MDRSEKITVTSPLLPSLDEFIPYLQDIWDRKWLTNNGYYHQQLEEASEGSLFKFIYQWYVTFNLCFTSIADYG